MNIFNDNKHHGKFIEPIKYLTEFNTVLQEHLETIKKECHTSKGRGNFCFFFIQNYHRQTS